MKWRETTPRPTDGRLAGPDAAEAPVACPQPHIQRGNREHITNRPTIRPGSYIARLESETTTPLGRYS